MELPNIRKVENWFLTNIPEGFIMYVVLKVQTFYSSLAQSVEHSAVNRSVVGSSPTGGVFYGNIRLHGQAVKTPPFHGGNRGSNPLGVTYSKSLQLCRHGSMAEQLICNQQVIGSSPIIGFLDL